MVTGHISLHIKRFRTTKYRRNAFRTEPISIFPDTSMHGCHSTYSKILFLSCRFCFVQNQNRSVSAYNWRRTVCFHTLCLCARIAVKLMYNFRNTAFFFSPKTKSFIMRYTCAQCLSDDSNQLHPTIVDK